MLAPRRYFSHKEEGGNQNNDLANAMNDVTIISVQEQKERFAKAPKILKDTFVLQDNGSFLVKKPEESKVMNGHLRDIPIVPGVVLKRLFLNQTQSTPKGVVSAQFLGGVFDEQNIIVRKDGIYTPAGKKIVDISINTNEEIPTVNDTPDISYMPMYEEEMDDYLLQQKAFRFVSRGEKDGVMQDESRFRGRFDIPEDFQRAEDGKINTEILEEIGAQIGSFVTGPDLNDNHSLIKEGKLNPDSKIFTFKLGKSLATDISANVGETVYVRGRVITFNPKGKEAHFCYRVENEKGEVLVSGEIKGNIVPLKLLSYGYEKTKNGVGK